MNFTDTESQIEDIKQIFADAKREDNWNLEEEMLYSYYFVDKEVEKLEDFGHFLEEKGYDFIDIFELGDEDTNEATGEFLLHIDKEETHTPNLWRKETSNFQNSPKNTEFLPTTDGNSARSAFMTKMTN